VNKPLFITEAALLFYGSSPTEEFRQTQADHLVRVVIRAMSANVQAHIWYTLHLSGWNSSGLLDNKNDPVTAYQAYRHLIERVGPYGYPKATSAYDSALEAYRFTKSATEVIDVLWSKDKTTDSVEIPRSNFIQAYSRDGDVIEPDYTETRAIVSVWVSPVYIERKPEAPTQEQPQITSVDPAEGYNDHEISLTIRGKNFSPGDMLWLERVTSKGASSYALQDISFLGNTTLQAVVPINLPPGSYDIVLKSATDDVALLRDAFTVQAYYPTIDEVRPSQGRADVASTLHIYGANFSQQSLIHLGNTLIPTSTLILEHSGYMRVQVPAGLLEPGTYDVSVTNPDTTRDSLKDAFTILSPDEVDFYSYPYHLWNDPMTPRVGDVHLGLVVHQQGALNPVQEVPVHFYISDPSKEENLIGTTTFLPAATSHISSTSYITMSFEKVGGSMICAVIDPDNQFVESSETNNTTCRTLSVQTRAIDIYPPHIRSFTINGQVEAHTTQRDVTLQVEAVDDVPEHMTHLASPVTRVIFQEYEYHDGSEDWVPMQSSEWITYTSGLTYTWNISPSIGKKYIQVWAADEPGNISQPVAASLIYTTTESPDITDPPGAPQSRTMPPKALPGLPSYTIYELYMPVVLR